ncbi:unnamed protein product, partial [Polarella glacialis]
AHPGDRAQRVTLELPGSLPELQYAATRHFGRNKQIKMYHHGKVPIVTAMQMASIKGGDVVVITVPDDMLKGNGAPEKSTSHSHYVRHKLD